MPLETFGSICIECSPSLHWSISGNFGQRAWATGGMAGCGEPVHWLEQLVEGQLEDKVRA